MSHARDVKVPLALAIQALLTQIAVPALEENGKEPKFVFLAQRHREGIAG